MSDRLPVDEVNPGVLNGKSALVLGGSLGPGLTTALTLAKAGARVTVADKFPHTQIVSHFKSQNLAVQYVRCDVTQWQQQVTAFRQAIQFASSRSLDIVCCFSTVDRISDIVNEVQEISAKIDTEPEVPDVDEGYSNLGSLLKATKLALHFFRIPDRATTLNRINIIKQRSNSSTSSGTPSLQSHYRSRSGSRTRSRSGSRAPSPIPAPPPAEPTEAPEEPSGETPTDPAPNTETNATVEPASETVPETTPEVALETAPETVSAPTEPGTNSDTVVEVIPEVTGEDSTNAVPNVTTTVIENEQDGEAPNRDDGEQQDQSKAEVEAKAKGEEGEEKSEPKQPEQEAKFIKSLVIVSGITAYIDDDGKGGFPSISNFASRGLFRSIRVKTQYELGVRVNLVAPWTFRTSATESRLKDMAERGLITKVEDDEASKAADQDVSEQVNGGSTQEKDKTVSEEADPVRQSSDDKEKEVSTEGAIKSGLENAEERPSTVIDTTVNQDSTNIESTVPAETSNTPADTTEPAEANSNSNTNSTIGSEVNSSEVRATEAVVEKDPPSSSTTEDADTSAADKTEATPPTTTETTKSTTTVEEDAASPEKQTNYKDLHFISLQSIANTIKYICAESKISGRAIAIMPEGSFDLQDDHEGSYAGIQTKKLINMRKEAGDLSLSIPGFVSWFSSTPGTVGTVDS